MPRGRHAETMGRRTFWSDSDTSNARRSKPLPKTDGVLMPLEDGTLKECPVNAVRENVEESDIASAILTGNLDVCRDADFSSHLLDHQDDGSLQFTFFKDPPCVIPFKKTSRHQDDRDQQAFQYWKDHATGLEQWPKLAEARHRNLNFVNSLGDRGHQRCSAVVMFRILVNVSIESVAIHSSSPVQTGPEVNNKVHPGELVVVRDTSFQQHGARWWYLRDKHGAVCDSKDGEQTLFEAQNLETGQWWYRVCGPQCIEVRVAPTYSDGARTRWVMCPREVALVCARCRIVGTEFVQLADGRGWVFTMRPCSSDLGGTYGGQEPVFEQCDDEFWELDARADVWSTLPPTEDVVEVGTWTYVVQERPVLCVGSKRHGTFLAPGDIVTVDKRTIANGDPFPGRTILNRFWVRLKDGRGWAPVLADDGKEQLKIQEPHDTLHPPWFKGRGTWDRAQEPWMVGLV